jgi:hypothetical protein
MAEFLVFHGNAPDEITSVGICGPTSHLAGFYTIPSNHLLQAWHPTGSGAWSTPIGASIFLQINISRSSHELALFSDGQ